MAQKEVETRGTAESSSNSASTFIYVMISVNSLTRPVSCSPSGCLAICLSDPPSARRPFAEWLVDGLRSAALVVHLWTPPCSVGGGHGGRLGTGSYCVQATAEASVYSSPRQGKSRRRLIQVQHPTSTSKHSLSADLAHRDSAPILPFLMSSMAVI
jgi:hypothetical protein